MFQITGTFLPNIRISMDGRGRWMDNVFIERPWRALLPVPKTPS